MNEDQFAIRCAEVLKDVHPGAQLVMMAMGAKQFAGDHIMCIACKDRTDAKCPAVEACNTLLAIAEESGHPEWVA